MTNEDALTGAPVSGEPEAYYRERATRFREEATAAARPTTRVANLRLLCAVAALLLLAVAAFAKDPLLGIPVPFLVAAFVLLVVYHRRLRRRLLAARAIAAVNEEALHRMRREWDALPPAPAITAPDDHPYARDLDIVGRASLLHLLDTTTSPMGEARLADWLLRPADPAVVPERQAAVVELGRAIDVCQDLEAAGWATRATEGPPPDPGPFARWAESASDEGPTVLRWCALLSPTLLWVTLVLWGVRVLPIPLWPLFLLTNAALAIVLGGAAQRTVAAVRLQQGRIAPYGAQLSRFAARRWLTPLPQRLQSAARPNGVSAEHRLRRLSRIVSFSVPTGSLLNGPIQLLFLWNVHLAWLAERWRRRSGRHVPQWLDALGEVEALAALGSLAHREGGWTLPEIDPAATEVEA
ncbi:MAG: hypothetical protein WAM30_17880, partial [Candidatus Dormiibacterota bacterium]